MNRWELLPSGFRPTSEQARKFRDYSVEHRQDRGNVYVRVMDDGTIIRFFASFYRIPSKKLFVLSVKNGATEAERRSAERTLAKLPEGWWAWYFCGDWGRRRKSTSSGEFFYRMIIGNVIDDDPLIQLELEQMIDTYTTRPVDQVFGSGVLSD